MAFSSGRDPIEAMEDFVAKVAPYDPRPDVRTVSVEIRNGRSHGVFELTERAARALTELLAGYVDPDDCGSCADCGNPLDKNLHCAKCGRVDGIFGLTIAQHAADVLRRERGDQGESKRSELTREA